MTAQVIDFASERLRRQLGMNPDEFLTACQKAARESVELEAQIDQAIYELEEALGRPHDD